MNYQITSNFSRNIVPLRQLKPFKPNIRDIRYCDMNFFSQSSNIPDWKNIPILRKFVNINEHSKLLLKIFNFEFFSNFSHKKTNTLSLVNIKNTSALNHFTPAEKLRIFKLKSKEIAFLKPFARQKNYMGKFNYSIDNLLEINNESENNKNRYMDLMFTRLNFDDVKTTLLRAEKSFFEGDFIRTFDETSALIKKINKSFSLVRPVMDAGLLIIGVLLKGTFGVGTFIAIFCMGPVANFFIKIFSKVLH